MKTASTRAMSPTDETATGSLHETATQDCGAPARVRALEVSFPFDPGAEAAQNATGGSEDSAKNVVDLPFVQRRRDARKAAFLKALRTGLPIGAICTALGIGRTTVHNWRKNDPAWDREFEDAQIEGLEMLEGKIIEHGARDWRALVRVLEARDPLRWNHRRCGACQARELREREAKLPAALANTSQGFRRHDGP